jgi:uncharacterized membrane protein
MTGVAPPYTRVWKKPGHGILEYPPSYADGVLYLAADSGWVGAYHAQSGELIWSKRFTKVLNQPAYYRGRVYFGSYDRNIYALDAATGKVVWKRNIGAQMESPPTLAAGRLYMGGLDGSVRSLDATTGRVLFYDSFFGLIDLWHAGLTWLGFMAIWHYGERGQWLRLFVVTYLLTAVGFLLWIAILAYLPAGTASLNMMAIPVIALLTSMVAFGERLTFAEGCGIACIGAGLAVVSLHSYYASRRNAQAALVPTPLEGG